MSETCAVCRQGKGPEKCEVCGFSDDGFINRSFPIREDAENWLETIVKPYRAQWEAKMREIMAGISRRMAEKSAQEALEYIENRKMWENEFDEKGFFLGLVLGLVIGGFLFLYCGSLRGEKIFVWPFAVLVGMLSLVVFGVKFCIKERIMLKKHRFVKGLIPRFVAFICSFVGAIEPYFVAPFCIYFCPLIMNDIFVIIKRVLK